MTTPRFLASSRMILLNSSTDLMGFRLALRMMSPSRSSASAAQLAGLDAHDEEAGAGLDVGGTGFFLGQRPDGQAYGRGILFNGAAGLAGRGLEVPFAELDGDVLAFAVTPHNHVDLGTGRFRSDGAEQGAGVVDLLAIDFEDHVAVLHTALGGRVRRASRSR